MLVPMEKNAGQKRKATPLRVVALCYPFFLKVWLGSQINLAPS